MWSRPLDGHSKEPLAGRLLSLPFYLPCGIAPTLVSGNKQLKIQALKYLLSLYYGSSETLRNRSLFLFSFNASGKVESDILECERIRLPLFVHSTPPGESSGESDWILRGLRTRSLKDADDLRR